MVMLGGMTEVTARTVQDVGVVQITDATFVDGMAGLRWRLRALVLDGVRTVVADLSGLRQLSSTAVAALLSAHRVCRVRGGGVVIRNPNRRNLDMLHRTGLHRVFTIENDRDVIPRQPVA